MREWVFGPKKEKIHLTGTKNFFLQIGWNKYKKSVFYADFKMGQFAFV
jgi:hypothetical protein